MRRLVVWLDKERVGEIRERNDIWSLVYDAGWQKNGYGLSPALPLVAEEIIDGSTHRPVQWFFDNLLPEEGVREVLSREAGKPVADSFGLLAYYGAESAGAITLLAEGDEFTLTNDVIPLTGSELSARIRKLPRLSLTREAPKKMSLAGAQHKLAVNYCAKDDVLFEPTSKAISTHILKPDHPETAVFYHTAVNEWLVMKLATGLGLAVPDVYLRFVPEPVFIIRRFDRAKRADGTVAGRVHTIDGCQLLNLSRASKYLQADEVHMQAIIDQCRSKALTRSRIFQWMLFNWLTGNDDAHLKNLSFFVSRDGVELAPFYDLLSTAVYGEGLPVEKTLVCRMGEARRFGEVDRSAIYALGEALGLPASACERQLRQLVDNCIPFFDALYKEFEHMPMPDGFGPYKGGALRMLREIRYKVLLEALRQLEAG